MRILAASFVLLLPAAAALAAPPDPARVVGPDECGECHEEAHEVWSLTTHARGWTELSRSEAARGLAEQLGIHRIKRDERCVSCHFLSAEVGGEVRPVAGVACESCHGAGREWIDVHWDFGPGVGSAGLESAEHRRERLDRSAALGLAGPAHVADLGAACYRCHVIADAALIEAGHPAPGPFDLALETQGAMRHNFVRGDGQNAVATPERRRLLLVLGRLLDWSATLRRLAAAPEESATAERLRARSAELRGLVEALQAAAPRPELESALGAPADPAAIDRAAHELAEADPGAELGALDCLLPPVPEG